MKKVAPFGSWETPFTAEALTTSALRLGEPAVVGDRVWWVEGRPEEGGRQVVVSAGPDGRVADVTPDGVSVRTTVHEYGGGSFTVVGDGGVVFSELAGQRLWSTTAGGDPRPLTPEGPQPGAWRYADGRAVPGPSGPLSGVSGPVDWLVCVRERHHGTRAGEVENDLVAVSLAGDREPVALVGGHDFFAAPRPSPDGRSLAWLAWDHPDMPWDGTQLWVADLADGTGQAPPRVGNARLVAGGREESVSQPRWGPEGRLYWVCDRTGWWNLYVDDGGRGRALAPRQAEFSRPDWVFGQSTYAFLDDGRMVASWIDHGVDHLGVIDPACEGLREVPTPFNRFTAVAAFGDDVVAIAESATEPAAVVVIPVDAPGRPAGDIRVLRRSRDVPVDPEWISVAEAVTFPTTGERSAHAFWYPPTNPDHEGEPGTLPPLVVLSHGGPTSSASPGLSLAIQFWTSRGLGVVDVDYGGSSGYGRAYRRVLDGEWGIVDVDDCVAAARHLVGQGKVDPARLVIRGGSAGGFTTLCALTFRDDFAAGASVYGVTDLASLAADTHKFESRYLDRLVGPRPDEAGRYRTRSPLHHTHRMACPVILLQGLEDRVVPPAQAEVMVAALRDNGVPVAYVTFAGEQHGFRASETIRAAAEAELSFYGQVLGFVPAGNVPPVPIENLATPA